MGAPRLAMNRPRPNSMVTMALSLGKDHPVVIVRRQVDKTPATAWRRRGVATRTPVTSMTGRNSARPVNSAFFAMPGRSSENAGISTSKNSPARGLHLVGADHHARRRVERATGGIFVWCRPAPAPAVRRQRRARAPRQLGRSRAVIFQCRLRSWTISSEVIGDHDTVPPHIAPILGVRLVLEIIGLHGSLLCHGSARGTSATPCDTHRTAPCLRQSISTPSNGTLPQCRVDLIVMIGSGTGRDWQ